MNKRETGPGDMMQKSKSFPLGASLNSEGVNFCVFSNNATIVELLLFDDGEDKNPSRILKMDPVRDRVHNYWHVFVPGIKAGQIYGFNVSGPAINENGHRFDGDKLLLDPYGLAVLVPSGYDRKKASQPGKNTASAMKSVVADPAVYDWKGDCRLSTPFSSSVIYEMHVKGFTANPNSGVGEKKRGTFHGIIEKIDYLKSLGITAVELLPVYQFDEQDAPSGLKNYWGYAPVSFFAPHASYSTNKGPLQAMDEFRDMVKALHCSGIEVILDVVYNHTAEGGEDGPILCFKGFENGAYYILDPEDKRKYADYTGCGNTFNANHPVVRRLIIDSLHYWVEEMHVDGFRFDLASILSRDESGDPIPNPPVLWDIDSDPVLAGVKLIAEAWDAAGLYQVGSFIGDSWKEWNGRFRDDVRRFIRGDKGMVSKFASRLLASPDIYQKKGQIPEQSINFITCHDGFTLNDLVSYNRKHNEANCESNRDGLDNNFSWNCGVEGPSGDPEIEKLRNRLVKNFFTVTLLSLGTPMILMGDEVRRTQNGNNNGYCQDNKISWVDWDGVKQNKDVYRFVRNLIDFRMRRDVSIDDTGLTLIEHLDRSDIKWHGVKIAQPDWNEDSHSIALTVKNFHGRFALHLIVNSYLEPLEFEIPDITGKFNAGWHRWIDTFLESPEDILDIDSGTVVENSIYFVNPHSIVALIAGIPGGKAH